MHDGTGVMVTFHPNKKPATRTYMNAGKMAGLYEELTPRGKQIVEGHHGRVHVESGPHGRGAAFVVELPL